VVLRNPKGKGWTPSSREGEGTESEEVAREWVTDYLRAMRRETNDRQLGIGDSSPRLSLSTQVDRYLADREKIDRVKRTTIINNHGALRILLSWFGPDAIPESIGAEDLQRHMNERLRAGAAASTCRTTKASLSRFFDWLGMGASNPARKLKIKGPRSAKKYGWSSDQLEKLREAADAIDAEGYFLISARYALELALATGVREGELFGLEGAHINEHQRTCKVVQQSTRYAHTLQETKGGEAGVTIILPDYWPFHRPNVKGLLLSVDGKPIRQSKERDVIEAVIQRAGMKQRRERTHMTRHTFARLFLEEYNGDLRDLQKFLRHKSLRTTEEYYGHYSIDVAVERANAKIYGSTLRAVRA
jgi:integrase